MDRLEGKSGRSNTGNDFKIGLDAEEEDDTIYED